MGDADFVDAERARLRLLRGRGASPDDGDGAADQPGLSRIGPKEAETMRLLAQGLTYEQIARRRGVSAATVR